MRTFKQFKVGDVEYTLSFDRFTSIHKNSDDRAYLRIVGNNREISFEIPRNEKIHHWGYRMYGFEPITDEHKAPEIRRIAMLFLTNQL